MAEPTEEQIHRGVEALIPIREQWNLPLNPEDLELMAYVVLLYALGSESSEAIRTGVEDQLAWVKQKRTGMYRMPGPPHPRPPTDMSGNT